MPRLGHHARRGLTGTGRVAMDLAGYGIGAVLGAISAARGGKAVHPAGAVYGGRLVVDAGSDAPLGSELLRTPSERAALVRFSRSLGVPRPLPDLLGVSLRVLDAYGPDRHQDLLMVSSVDVPVLRRVFVPATDFQQRPYSSSLPYRAGEETFLFGIVPDPASPRLTGDDEYERLDRAAATGRLVFGLAVASGRGRFRRIGSLHVAERLPASLDALRFNPFNAGGGLEPTGPLNRLRDYAYPMSQAAWGTRRGRTQREADATLREITRPSRGRCDP